MIEPQRGEVEVRERGSGGEKGGRCDRATK
jgi:hypothetical protein